MLRNCKLWLPLALRGLAVAPRPPKGIFWIIIIWFYFNLFSPSFPLYALPAPTPAFAHIFFHLIEKRIWMCDAKQCFKNYSIEFLFIDFEKSHSFWSLILGKKLFQHFNFIMIFQIIYTMCKLNRILKRKWSTCSSSNWKLLAWIIIKAAKY